MTDLRRDTLLRLDHAAARQKILERRQAFAEGISIVMMLAIALPAALGLMIGILLHVLGSW